MRNEMLLNQDHQDSEGPRGLVLVESGTDNRFGAIHYGVSPDKQAAGVWGDHIPLVIIPERAKELANWSTFPHGKRKVAIEADGQTGWLHVPLGGCLNPMPMLSRRARAIHVDFPDRRYQYFRRRFHIRCERRGAGEVVRHGAGTFRITDRADSIDAAVGLLTARVIGENYVTLIGGIAGSTDPGFVETK